MDDLSRHKHCHPLSSQVPSESQGEERGSLSSSFDFRQEKWYPEVGLVIRLLSLCVFLSFLIFSPPLSLDCLLHRHGGVLATPHPPRPSGTIAAGPLGLAIATALGGPPPGSVGCLKYSG